ncbi:MAG: YidC/Oxa1 family insertase periplasmic-domain containing protein [Sedimentisphaerales bacterium]
MRITLIVAASFCLFSGWFVRPACGSDANSPAKEEPRLIGADAVHFGADNAPAASVTLGSIDPRSGFKFELELTSKGAAIRKAAFSEFGDRNYKNPQPLAILSPVKLPDDSEVLSMANKEFLFVQQQQQLPLDKLNWKTSDVEKAADGSQKVCFEAIIKDQLGKPFVKLTKTYRVTSGSYLLDCDLIIENLSTGEQKVQFNLTGPVGISREDVSRDDKKVVAGFRDSQGGVISVRLDANRLNKARTADDRRLTKTGANFLWAAVVNKYFAAVLVPVPDANRDYCDWVTDKTGRFYNPDGDAHGDTGDETVGVDLKIASRQLAAAGHADSTRTYNFQLYLGPKDKSLFDKNDMYRTLGFVQTIDFMACCCPASIISPLAFGILAIMKWMHSFIGNYGVVIIILVFLMRLVMHPITKKSQVSMSKMQKVLGDPEVQEIREKYAKTPMEMQKRISAFQRERGISPASGVTSMLPMFVQMPIWIALWSAVYTSIDLRGAAFLPFWITDLSAPDALVRFSMVTVPMLGWKVDSLNLLPILMGVAFYLQQKLTPQQAAASANPQVAQQQKMMMIMMPLLFPLMLYKAPSGVNLYIMASTFAGVIEQYVIKKHIREKEDAESQGLVAVTSKTGGKVKKKKPKPFFRT